MPGCLGATCRCELNVARRKPHPRSDCPCLSQGKPPGLQGPRSHALCIVQQHPLLCPCACVRQGWARTGVGSHPAGGPHPWNSWRAPLPIAWAEGAESSRAARGNAESEENLVSGSCSRYRAQARKKLSSCPPDCDLPHGSAGHAIRRPLWSPGPLKHEVTWGC